MKILSNYLILSEVASKKTVWVILYTQNKLILGKRSPSVNNPNQWNFFGGQVDPGESDQEAAVREVAEETNFKINISDLKEIEKIGNSTYYVVKISDPSSLQITNEISKIKTFKLVNLPDNLHSKTQSFFDQLDTLFK